MSTDILGRYRIVAKLGEGGMGEVWKAHDTRLDRVVAIKMLRRGGPSAPARDDGRERFRREALALSRLSHDGIATVFDFESEGDHDFLVMEFVPGGTLESRLREGPLAFAQIVPLGITAADALEHAHRHGVLHRDLKPGNVALTLEGRPKILDFGIARLVSGDAVTGRLTQAGTIMGSLAYMAPEQLMGEHEDPRTDVYALGVILFELATGQRPFPQERPQALMFAIVNTPAPSVRTFRPEATIDFGRLVASCLEKDPRRRPASAASVAEALRGLSAGQGPASSAVDREAPTGIESSGVIRTIAVLPFRNVSQDPAQEYFADGMTEAVIADLSRIKSLRVISRTSAMKYKGTSLSLPEIARQLNVEAILEGSAHLVGDRVRLTVQLIAANTDETRWAERYDRQLEHVLDLQSQLAERVAREIAVQLTPAEATQLAHRHVVNPEAHLEYLKGRHSAWGGSPEGVALGLRYAKRALELDPDFAAAWSALADCHIIRGTRGMAPGGEAAREALKAARRALELDPSLADAHVSIGVVQMHTGDLAGSVRSLRHAIELNPALALAHNMLARALSSYGRHEEALAAAQTSVSLDPLAVMLHTILGDAYYFARQYEKALLSYRMAIELDPRFASAHTDLARALEALGRFDEARAACERGQRLSGGIAGPSFALAHLEAAAGNIAEARRILAELTAARTERIVSAWGIGAVHASLGDIDEAYRWLDVAVQEKASGLLLLRVHPRLDPIRSDARYWPLVRRVGLDDPEPDTAGATTV
jgi:serine/threonine protein kinase/tetratricopeptide (TPR) repeat protein